jgi:hypothetical protein
VKDLKQFISGLTFARRSNQPFISNAIVFLSSLRADIFRLFNFENTVEGIPLLILIYHMDNILTPLYIAAGDSFQLYFVIYVSTYSNQ